VSLPQSDFDFVRDLVRDQAGVVIEDGKDYLVESRLNALLRETEFDSRDALLRCLRDRSRSSLRDRLVQNTLVNETFFFRDTHPFNALRDDILPELIESRRAERSLAIWCAACATGQEPYSVSMLIADHFPSISGWKVWIRGSDYSESSIEKAREGIYSGIETSRGLTDDQRQRHFERTGDDEFQVNGRIRERTDFFRHNLSRPWPADGQKDLVMLRNVLIYFDEESRAQILDRIGRSLRCGGYLVLGTTESLPAGGDVFEQMQYGRTICYRKK
jgi:chemotaxis protein methyltransferase CheR